jgi:hypothetical protein
MTDVRHADGCRACSAAKVLDEVTGVRCAGCGHLVSVMIRVYGQPGREAA